MARLGGGGIVSALLLPACSSGSGTDAKGGDIEVWGAFASDAGRRWYEENVIQAFNEQSDEGQVSLAVKQIATIDRLTQTAIASGSGPDLVGANGPSQLVAYADNGNLAPMDEYAESLGWSDTFLPWALETGKIDGKLYGMPTSSETLVMYYNPATFEANGWAVPTTREDFEAICEDAAAKGIMPVAAGNADYKPSTEWHVSWLWNSFVGPEVLYQALTGDRSFSDPVFVDSIAAMKGWFDKGWFGGSTDRYFTNGFPDQYTRLAAGDAAMMFSGSWVFAEIPAYFGENAAGAEWDWAPLPSMAPDVPAGIFPLAVGGSIAINKDSPNKDLAARFVDFTLTDAERNTSGAAAVGNGLPPLAYTQADFPADIDPRVQRQYTELTDAQTVGYTTWTFWPAKTDTYIYEEMDKVIAGQVTPEEYCTGLAETFEADVADGQGLPVPAPQQA